jgi:hypothetical protein
MNGIHTSVAAAAALGILGFAGPAQAVTSVTNISGSMGITQSTCLQGLTNAVGDGEDCTYNGAGLIAPNDPTAITGPYEHIRYYDSLATPAAFASTIVGSARVLYAPSEGDGKMSQSLTGSVTVDDGGDGFGAGDLISFSFTLTSSGGGDIVRSYGASIVEKYTSMTQTLTNVAASSATANGFGGFDYVIGSAGFPTLLTFAGTTGSNTGSCVGQAFGSVDCAYSFNTPTVEPDFWNGTTTAGLGLLEGNAGAKTTGSVSNLACIDSRSATNVESNDCRDSQVAYSPYLGVAGTCLVAGGCVVGGARGASEDVGWDNLLLKVSTDAAGNVIALAGFNVDDYRVFGNARCGDNVTGDGSTGTYTAICNSWTSGYFTAAAQVVPVPAAVWLMGSALGLLGWMRRRATA